MTKKILSVSQEPQFNLFSNFLCGFRSFQSTADLLTVVSDRIASAFNRPGAIRSVALDISRTFDRAQHTGLLYKLEPYGISGQIFGLISFFLVVDSFQWFWSGPQGSILGWTLFLVHVIDRPHDIICGIGIYVDDTTLYSQRDQASVLWQEVKLTSKLEFDLPDTVDWGRNWLVDFNAGKTQLVWFDQSYQTGAIDVKIDRSVLEERSSFKMLVLSSKLDWTSSIVCLAKTASKKIRALICSMKCRFLGVALYDCRSTLWSCMEYCSFLGCCSQLLLGIVR